MRLLVLTALVGKLLLFFFYYLPFWVLPGTNGTEPVILKLTFFIISFKYFSFTTSLIPVPRLAHSYLFSNLYVHNYFKCETKLHFALINQLVYNWNFCFSRGSVEPAHPEQNLALASRQGLSLQCEHVHMDQVRQQQQQRQRFQGWVHHPCVGTWPTHG